MRLRWFQSTDNAHVVTVTVIDDELDRIDALSDAAGSRATRPHQLRQLGA